MFSTRIEGILARHITYMTTDMYGHVQSFAWNVTKLLVYIFLLRGYGPP
jgi:hypothetical protein